MRRGLYNRVLTFHKDDIDDKDIVSINLGYDTGKEHEEGIEPLKAALNIDQNKYMRWLRAGSNAHRMRKNSSLIVRGDKYGLILAADEKYIDQLKELITPENIDRLVSVKNQPPFHRNGLSVEGIGTRGHVGAWDKESAAILFDLKQPKALKMFEDFSKAFKAKDVAFRLSADGGLVLNITSRNTLDMERCIVKNDLIRKRQKSAGEKAAKV